MDKTIQLEKHQIEAWGLWWIQWQKQTKERLLKHTKSPKVFLDTHLVSPQDESFSGNATSSSAVTLVLLPK
jgi:hypothetical protein